MAYLREDGLNTYFSLTDKTIDAFLGLIHSKQNNQANERKICFLTSFNSLKTAFNFIKSNLLKILLS